MRNIIILFFTIFFSFLSCKNENRKIIQGDLYFKLIDFKNTYGLYKKEIEKIRKSIDSIRKVEYISENSQETINYFDKLEKYKLIELPTIRIKTDSNIVKIFLTEKEFLKIKTYNHSDLIDNQKKVILQIEIIELEEGIFFSNKIIHFVEAHGKTYWKK